MKIKHFRELTAYQLAKKIALKIYDLSKSFPAEERYSLTDQIRRASRSVCANLAEAWRKRMYKPAFIAKLSDSEGECAETQVWLEFALAHNFIAEKDFIELDIECEYELAMLVKMRINPEDWVIK
jgi:four helix bundle protein